jgi:hypothetical protein
MHTTSYIVRQQAATLMLLVPYAAMRLEHVAGGNERVRRMSYNMG